MNAKKKVLSSVSLYLLFICYLYILVKVILFKFHTIDLTFLRHQLLHALEQPDFMLNRLQFANFTPFLSISQNIERIANPHDLINLMGNIIIFVPYGMFITLMSKTNQITCFECFARSLSLTLSLECAQAIFSIGSFDVDDLILNVTGAMIGYIVIKNLSKLTIRDEVSLTSL